MKKVFVSICIAGAALAMSSCRSVEKAIPLSSINGEWNIIEVNGSKIAPGESRTLPFIAFDTATGRVSGNSGCNRMMGSFDVNAKPGSLELTGMASTRMMCPDMTTENNVLNAFAQVKGYKKAGKDKMYLCNSSNRPVVVLQKKEADVKLSVLNGEWKIKEVNEDVQNCDEIETTNAYHILEGEARARFRKWDNVKYITEIPKSRPRAKKSYSNKNWGMEIKTNNRLNPKDGEGIRFGVVVTLKEINGISRIDEFIKNCTLNGWLVNRVDIKARIDIHKKFNEEIEFQ